MKFKLKKITSFVFCFLLFLNPFFSGDFFSVLSFVMLTGYLLILKTRFPHLTNLAISYLLSIFILGVFVGIFNGINKDYLRDIWIFFKPIYIIFFGALLALKYAGTDKKIFQVIIIAGVISALYHYVEILIVPGFRSMSLADIREETRRASLIEALALGLIIYDLRKLKLKIFPKRYMHLFGAIISLSILLFVSRTMFLIFFIYIGFFFNYFRLSIKAILVTVIVVSFLGYIFSLPEQSSDTSATGTLISKIQKSPSELFFTSEQANNQKDINEDWRGYEAFRAVTQTIKQGAGAVIFGNGFGSLVDLKLVMHLGDDDYRYIPRLHDGYAQLFFKTGIVSVILYLMYLVSFYRKTYSITPQTDNMLVMKKIILASIVILLLTTSTITGIYNDSSLDSVLLLMIFCFVRLKNQETEEPDNEPVKQVYKSRFVRAPSGYKPAINDRRY